MFEARKSEGHDFFFFLRGPERLLDTFHGRAVQLKAVVQRALLADAERERDVDVAALRRAAGTMACRYNGRGHHPNP